MLQNLKAVREYKMKFGISPAWDLLVNVVIILMGLGMWKVTGSYIGIGIGAALVSFMVIDGVIWNNKLGKILREEGEAAFLMKLTGSTKEQVNKLLGK